MSAAMGFFPWDSRTSSKKAVVNEPSVFEPLNFFCTLPLALEHNIFRNLRFKIHVTVSNQLLLELSLDFFSNMEICSDLMNMCMNFKAGKIFSGKFTSY